MRRAIQVYVALNMVVIGGTLWFALAGHALYRNVGVSLAPGWYLCHPLTRPHLLTGEILQLEPSAGDRDIVQRLAPHEPHTGFWMKQLVAQEGHTVCLQGDTVTVQGKVIAHRPLLASYPLVRIDGCWTLEANDIFVLGTHRKSFDSRYSGPWSRHRIHGTCDALWTWEATP